jgi:hypothetical protein
MARRKSVDEILSKYSNQISRKISNEDEVGDISREYTMFKRDMVPRLSKFENFVKSFSFLNLSLSRKDNEKIQHYLNVAHLDITPSQVAAASFMGAFMAFAFALIISIGLYFFQDGFTTQNMIFLALAFFASMFVFYFIYSSPSRLANLWRLKASSQMVPCILYIVIYMKHTSNLERAIGFASKHLRPPLSLDLKKVFWDVETGKYSTIKESLDHYLQFWERDSLEFVEAFHLIESSLYESSNARRIQTLEKALDVILDGVHDKMLRFSREVRSPLTNVYMLGVVLPTLGLALLPLATALLGGAIQAYHVFIIFNLIIPFFVFYLTTGIILKRPGGYGESEILELNPNYPEYKSKAGYVNGFLIALPLLVIGLLPFILQIGFIADLVSLTADANGFVDFDLGTFGFDSLEGIKAFDFKINSEGKTVGPFGSVALLLSLFIPLSIALFFSIAYSSKTKKIIISRENTKQLEREFTNSLFQLGNRLGDGTPAEIAFAKVADSTRGQKTEDFFRRVNINLHQAGMSLERSIFDPRRGAIIYFPSQLISTSMHILLESVKKGLKIAAESLMSISEYLKNIDKVEERLKDLLAEVISDMRSNMVFLAPLLSGIVVGLSGMITFILNKLSAIFDQIGSGGSSGIGFDIGTLVGGDGLFQITYMVPPYFMQIVIGIYIIQIIFILTNVLVTINSGEDKLKRTHDVGKNLSRGVMLYFVITLISVLVLSLLAAISLAGISG